MTKKNEKKVPAMTEEKTTAEQTPEEKENLRIAVLAAAVASHIPVREARQLAAITRNWVRNPKACDDRILKVVAEISKYLAPHVEKYLSLADKIVE